MKDLAGLFESIVAEAPGLPALIEDGRTTTFGDWWHESALAAGVLAEHGVTAGDVVGVALHSGHSFAAWFLGALRLGAVASGINPRLGPVEVAHITARMRPRAVVGGAGGIDGELPQRGGPVLDGWFRPPPGAPAVIVWTTGTTGLPKGAWFDHEALRFIATNLGPLSARHDRKLMPIPFAHAGYTTRVYDQLVHRSALVVTPPAWDAPTMLRVMARERVTVGQGVPTQWEKLIGLPEFGTVDLSALRLVATGGSHVPPALVRRLRRSLGCPVVVRYASTEVPLAFGTRPDDPAEVVASTVGSALGGAQLEIVSPDGKPLPAGGIGRIRLRSPAAMRGYWNDPDATDAALSAEGWVTTSDLGSVDARGDLTIVGRADDAYIRGGYNVHPAEVEAALTQHPSVARAAVVGTPAPVIGEIGVAFLVLAAGAVVDPEELRVWCRERIADYKVPHRIEVLDDLPLNATFKVDVARLRAIAAEPTTTPRPTDN